MVAELVAAAAVSFDRTAHFGVRKFISAFSALASLFVQSLFESRRCDAKARKATMNRRTPNVDCLFADSARRLERQSMQLSLDLNVDGFVGEVGTEFGED